MSVAEAHQADQIRVSDTAVARVLRAWQRVDMDALSESWDAGVGASVVGTVSAAQRRSAAFSNGYMGALGTGSRDRVVPVAFSGVDGDGRDVDGLLYGAVTTTKTEIGRGSGRVSAFEAGAYYLAAITKTLIGDMARSADITASAGAGFTRYVRVIEPGACGRCVMLAGVSGMKPFQRHPACRCTVQPVRDGAQQSPDQIFQSMSEAEQERAFTKAGAQAIRDGADMNQVVNVRRKAAGISYSNRYGSRPFSGRRLQPTVIGARADGTPIRVYTAGTRQGRLRLMPETILEIAPDDPAIRRAMLRDAGYLDFPPTLPLSDRLQAQARDRQLVDRIYRSRGITL